MVQPYSSSTAPARGPPGFISGRFFTAKEWEEFPGYFIEGNIPFKIRNYIVGYMLNYDHPEYEDLPYKYHMENPGIRDPGKRYILVKDVTKKDIKKWVTEFIEIRKDYGGPLEGEKYAGLVRSWNWK
jgi:hypothetical protein